VYRRSCSARQEVLDCDNQNRDDGMQRQNKTIDLLRRLVALNSHLSTNQTTCVDGAT
jgi:hypothetical protein